jgi:hypothetical protein
MSALENARRNAVVLREKGLDGRARTYEIRHVSHDGGEALERDPATSYIELPRVMETLFERLDQWVTKGVEPPATRSDSARFGASSDLSAITLPEAACPLGAYHPWPGITGPKTAFTPFGSNDLEPLDDAGRFVDMNQNGIRDRRETLTQAWRRLGLLKPNEELTRGRFVDCVRDSVTTLRQDGFVNDATVQWYLAQAEKVQVVSASDR